MARRNSLVHPGFFWIKRSNSRRASTAKIKVLLAHQHTLFREALSKLLKEDPDMEVVGEAADGLEAARCCWLLAPDVLVMDIALPPSGLKALTVLLRPPSAQRSPTLSDSPRILVLAFPLNGEEVLGAIEAGVPGILEDCDSAELGRAIRTLHRGQSFFSAAAAGLAAQKGGPAQPQATTSSPLTAEERKILYLIAQGMSNRQIAQVLSVSPKTVRNRLFLLFRKLNLQNRTQAALYALREGLAHLDQASLTPAEASVDSA